MRRHTEAKARDLKPCPFCGAAAAVDRDKRGVIRSVDCSATCDLRHPTGVDWNTRPIEDALRARAEAAEARAAQAEAAGYRRAIDEACVALGKRAGHLRNFDLAEEIVRALAPVEPVSPADELPGGAA